MCVELNDSSLPACDHIGEHTHLDSGESAAEINLGFARNQHKCCQHYIARNSSCTAVGSWQYINIVSMCLKADALLVLVVMLLIAGSALLGFAAPSLLSISFAPPSAAAVATTALQVSLVLMDLLQGCTVCLSSTWRSSDCCAGWPLQLMSAAPQPAVSHLADWGWSVLSTCAARAAGVCCSALAGTSRGE